MPQAPRVGIATGPHLTPSATVSPDLGTAEGCATLIAEVPEVDVLVSASRGKQTSPTCMKREAYGYCHARLLRWAQ